MSSTVRSFINEASPRNTHSFPRIANGQGSASQAQVGVGTQGSIAVTRRLHEPIGTHHFNVVAAYRRMGERREQGRAGRSIGSMQ